MNGAFRLLIGVLHTVSPALSSSGISEKFTKDEAVHLQDTKTIVRVKLKRGEKGYYDLW